MKKCFFYLVSALLLSIGATGCGNGDEVNKVIAPQKTPDHPQGTETSEGPSEEPEVTNGGEETDEGSYMLSADYFLTNEKGENTTAFGYGEDIIFNLIVNNDGDGAYSICDENELIKSAYIVYTSDSQYVNCAYTYMEEILRSLSIAPGEQHVWQQKWERDPLPVGDYYTTFVLDVEGQETKEYTINFKVE